MDPLQLAELPRIFSTLMLKYCVTGLTVVCITDLGCHGGAPDSHQNQR
jgi:hypothetical protein